MIELLLLATLLIGIAIDLQLIKWILDDVVEI